MNGLRAVDPNESAPHLAGAGGGGNNGDMERQIAKLEATSEHTLRELSELRQDMREVRGAVRVQTYWMVGAFAWFTLAIASILGVMAKGFGWL